MVKRTSVKKVVTGLLLLVLGISFGNCPVIPVSATPDFEWHVSAAEGLTCVAAYASGYFYEENDQQYMRVDVGYGVFGFSVLWVGTVEFFIGREFDIVDSNAPYISHHVTVPWWTNPFWPTQGEGSTAGAIVMSPFQGGSFYVICRRINYGSNIAWSQLGAVLVAGRTPKDFDFDFQVRNLPGDAGTSGDAGDTFSKATSISLGYYEGGADKSNDPNDYYRFNIESGWPLHIGLTPPSGYDYDLYLYNPAGTLKAYSVKWGDATEYISFTTDSSGEWRVRIYVYSSNGVGLYQFYVSTDAVAVYHLDEGSGSTAGDSSPYGNTGTIYGATWTTGKVGYALSFDGINDYVSVANAPSLKTKDAISVEAWVKPKNPYANDRNKAVFRHNTFNFQPGFQYATRTFRFEVHVEGVGWVGLVTSNYAVDWDVWQHFACTYDGSYMRIYKNGKEICSRAQTGKITAPDGTLVIGAHDTAGSHIYKGIIDEVRIYNRALSPQEIADHAAG